MKGKILAVCVSKKKGTQKENVGSGEVKANHGIEGDAHSGAMASSGKLVGK